MPYLFTSESVSAGHPDKVADQISDAMVDHYLAGDPHSKVACETLVTTGLVVLSGEVKSNSLFDHQKVARELIKKIGYDRAELFFDGDSCGILSAIHEQSDDINRGVEKETPDEQGAGDQGMMFGFATNESVDYMPLALLLSHRILQVLSEIREGGREMTYLRPDAKAQVTIEYNDDNQPARVDTIVVSTQHDEFDSDKAMAQKISADVKNILIPRVVSTLHQSNQALFDDNIKYHINPTGKFVIGGPHGDTGLTGRKIIVDTYGGKGAHGGGAFSGKDPSKVDRSAAYATRHIAKNLVAAGVADQILVQVAYAIGVAEPMNIFVETYGSANVELSDSQIAEKVREVFDMRPGKIVERLKLTEPIYAETAAYGHMGRKPQTVKKTFDLNGEGSVTKEVEVFIWEKLDYVDKVKDAFGLS
jgi:S-adenosylmethionine synthetase